MVFVGAAIAQIGASARGVAVVDTRRKPIENLDAYYFLLQSIAHSYGSTRGSLEEALRLELLLVPVHRSLMAHVRSAPNLSAFRGRPEVISVELKLVNLSVSQQRRVPALPPLNGHRVGEMQSKRRLK